MRLMGRPWLHGALPSRADPLSTLAIFSIPDRSWATVANVEAGEGRLRLQADAKLWRALHCLTTAFMPNVEAKGIVEDARMSELPFRTFAAEVALFGLYFGPPQQCTFGVVRDVRPIYGNRQDQV